MTYENRVGTQKCEVIAYTKNSIELRGRYTAIGCSILLVRNILCSKFYDQ